MGGGHQRPSGTENPAGKGGANQKVIPGGGMDIFWNHTFGPAEHTANAPGRLSLFPLTLQPLHL